MGDSLVDRITGLQAPQGGSPLIGLILGVVNILWPGFGVIIAGALDGNQNDIIIGIMQFILAFFFIGWIWAVVWGILMIINNAEGASGELEAQGNNQNEQAHHSSSSSDCCLLYTSDAADE
eukprot:TRINITY_DN2740_c0_g2_i4.p1 TRINITY_DN2740_c0_g2~~TRINITY_DN2740_c0_g2_i4.p1  ORF type:complete len:121 (-),score=19.14 TRINITY_DN2740_c0_g2_i4:20-382(-)